VCNGDGTKHDFKLNQASILIKKNTRTKGFINPMNWFQDQIISTTKTLLGSNWNLVWCEWGSNYFVSL
jgi:hypothetical protein